MKKDGIVILRIEPELKDHLNKQAKKEEKSLSEYIRDAVKKIAKFK